MSQQLENFQRQWSQNAITRPPTPHPFVKPQNTNGFDSTMEDVNLESAINRITPHNIQSRMKMARTLHKSRRAIAIRQLNAGRDWKPTNTSSLTKEMGRGLDGQRDLAEAMDGLVLEGKEEVMSNTGPRCRLCGHCLVE
ncbi:hypothetical protein CEP54_014865 [Fusarium duplospermum]|uniref:Uncharacterized protein n=1 Tax=Fusarium duplospermum TaxID=1325734 RepID=A0A428NT54_9HYPO|nr:hypothetical protein CEP54_014865 [Fusarium duplospermum]